MSYKIQRLGLAGRNSALAEAMLNALEAEGFEVLQILPAGTTDAYAVLHKKGIEGVDVTAPSVPDEEAPAPKKRGRPRKED
jgi:hypothetical protein